LLYIRCSPALNDQLSAALLESVEVNARTDVVIAANQKLDGLLPVGKPKLAITVSNERVSFRVENPTGEEERGCTKKVFHFFKTRFSGI
jgi:hypothetical protein